MSDEAFSELSVDRAFAGKRVLITGTSGFIGKVVLEKNPGRIAVK